MTSRLALKYGLVSERDRLSNSSDAIVVTEPTTGSKSRTKGSLYVVATTRLSGGRTRDACKLVADTIRREYYYDESAGIPIVLQKSIRAANRRLLQSREGGAVGEGSFGLAVAVVRGNELYVATSGEAEAYLVRAARLLMPEHEAGPGLPLPEGTRIDVWKGDFSVGDSLVLCSRNLVEVVGTEEIKNAVVTLHPQSAVEHLHHLFVAAGGDGSDAALAIEASEVATTHSRPGALAAVPAYDPLAGSEEGAAPIGDQLSDAATAVQERAAAARSALSEAVSGGVAAVSDLLPRRRPTYRRIVPAASRGETRRRQATALLAFLGVIAVLGVGLWLWGGPLRGSESSPPNVSEGEAAFTSAQSKTDQVFGDSNLLVNDPSRAQTLLGEAWLDLGRAADAGADTGAVAALRSRLASGLDRLYETQAVASTQVYSAPEGSEITGLVRGPDEEPYLIVGREVFRVDLSSGAAVRVIQPGDGPAQGIGAPRLLSRGGPDLLIVDIRGDLWRWRPADEAGGGTLLSMRVAGEEAWGQDVVDIRTFLVNPDQGLYRLYVPHPTSAQILRYEPVADGSGFLEPNPYFVSEGEDVAEFHQLFIDGDIYALTDDDLLRYFNGRRTSYSLAVLPDEADLRPGHRFERMAATGTRGEGRLYIWDAEHQRLILFEKADGSYVEQYVGRDGEPTFDDVRGMYLVESAGNQAPTLVWATAAGLFQTVLAPAPDAEPSAEPTGAAVQSPAGPTLSPGASGAEPPQRPRRTPRDTPAASPQE
jgi:hypothetical protein